MTDWSERRKAFRQVIEGQACVHPASIFDPMSARIAQSIGKRTFPAWQSLAPFSFAESKLGLENLTPADSPRRIKVKYHL